MKFLVLAALVAVAAAGPARFITPGGAGPAPIIDSPISIAPVVVDDFQSPAHVEHAYIDTPSTVYNSPLVQVIVNVKPGSPAAPAPVEEIEPTPVIVVDNPVEPEPIIVAPIPLPEIEPTPVIVVDQPEQPEPVIVAPIPELPIPEPVIVAPIEVAPVITLPDELN